ncbi:hypothetical protein BGZ76_000676 [Entomortierella beljakovae]|nr:hypothetical protein BGZ76_000676 [Entomortierella beljakovae]
MATHSGGPMPPIDSAPGDTPPVITRFEDIVFDIILLEIATNCQSTSGESPDELIPITITYNELAKAFEIAYSTCKTYVDTHPKDHQSTELERVLYRAQLSVDMYLRNYIEIVCQKGVAHLHDCLPMDTGLPPDIISTSFKIPAPGEKTYIMFKERYPTLLPHQQDMISRIVFRLRIDLWDHPVTQKELDTVMKDGVYLYSSRRAKIKSRKTTSTRDESSYPDLGIVTSALFAGLQINSGVNHRTTYGLRGELMLKTTLVTDSTFLSISNSMMSLYESLVPGRRCLEARSRLMQKLQRMLDNAFPGDYLRIQEFGSCASGLGSETSDADLCITTITFQKSKQYNNMRNLATLLRNVGMIRVQPITGARVPIVKFIDPSTKINCDLNTNHSLGIHNSELIRCYTLIDDRVRPLLYNIKAIVKKHRINDSSQSWLSSYAYVMMAIGFLQAQVPSILPSLQSQPNEYMTELSVTEECDNRGKRTFDCTFDRNYDRHKGFGAANKKTAGQLLIEFFEYYTRYFDYQTMEVNVRLGGVRPRGGAGGSNGKNGMRGRGEKQLFVKDPFIRDRNVSGSCKGRHLAKVWRVFEYVYLNLSKGDFKAAIRDIPDYYFRDVEDHHLSILTGYKPQSIEASASASNHGTARSSIADGPSSNIGALILETSSPSQSVKPEHAGSSHTKSKQSVDASNDDSVSASRSKKRRDREATARKMHNGQGQGTDATNNSSTSAQGSSSTTKSKSKSKQYQSTGQPTGKPAKTTKPKPNSSNSKKSEKKLLEAAFPVLEKTRKSLLEKEKRKLDNDGTNTQSSGNVRPAVGEK